MSPEEAFGVFFILIGCAAPVVVIGIIYYLKKRLEHRQIMAAIEKGTPLSDLRPPRQNGTLWVKNLTVGIALLLIGLGWGFMVPLAHEARFVAIILMGVGIAWIIRGILNRKSQLQKQVAQETGAARKGDPL